MTVPDALRTIVLPQPKPRRDRHPVGAAILVVATLLGEGAFALSMALRMSFGNGLMLAQTLAAVFAGLAALGVAWRAGTGHWGRPPPPFTHRVPAGGVVAWEAPGSTPKPLVRLAEGGWMRVIRRRGDWVEVVGPDLYGGWVDGRLLRPFPSPLPTEQPLPPVP